MSLQSNLDASITLLKASLAETKAAAAARKAAASIITTPSPIMVGAYRPGSAPAPGHVQKLSYTRASGLEGTVVSRSTLSKHVMRYNTDEVGRPWCCDVLMNLLLHTNVVVMITGLGGCCVARTLLCQVELGGCVIWQQHL